jgi:farnesyl-diphosphate farnesyltransferase
MRQMEPPLPETLESILSGVSRSFYLTLRVLPRLIRPQIALGYLLARAGDTIADTSLVDAVRRVASLGELGDAVEAAVAGQPPPPIELGDLTEARSEAPAIGSAAEKALLESIPAALAVLRGMSTDDRARIGSVLRTIFSGQRNDVTRFSSTVRNGIVALENDAELEDYTYRVAGCVGEFWTRTCRAHLFPKARLDDSVLLAEGIRFGKGLQLINILRDLPVDLRERRCYIPRTRLESFALQPQALLEPSAMETFRPLFLEYVDRALDHLAAGWHYTLTIPFNQARVRLACAWPILIGARTLARLRGANVLDSGQVVRITRAELRGFIVRSVVTYPFPAAWGRLFDMAQNPKGNNL